MMTSVPDDMTSEEFIRHLLAPDRAEHLDPFRVLSFSDINSHETIADVGCGPGFFTIPLAKFLISGKVYALDIDEDMLTACRQQVNQARLGNVEILKCNEYEFPSEQESLDGAFLAFVLQQSPDKLRFLQAVRGLLRTGGWCSVLEWYRKEIDIGPPLERRIDPPDLEALARRAGYSAQGWRDLNGDQYMMNLRRA